MARWKLPWGTASTLAAYLAQQREIFFDTTNNRPRTGDGVTLGGRALAFQDEIATLPVGSDVSSGDVLAVGATTENTLSARSGWVYDVRDFGAITLASNSAATINAATINAAITAVSLLGGGFIMMPRGVVWSGAITLKTGVYLVGQKSGSTLKAKNSLNANFIEGENTASLYGGTTTGGIYDAGLIDLVVDGNKANQSSGHAVRIYGRSIRIECVSITNAKERGLSTKWGNPGLLVAPVARGVENIIRNVYIDFAGQEGFYHEGPNDSYHSDVFVVSCGQDTTNTYDNVVATGPYGHAHWTRLHSWRWSPGSYAGFVYPRYALRVESEGNEFDSCDLEGGYTGNVYLTGGFNAFNATCAFYGVRTGGSNVIIRSSFNTIHGRLSSPESGTCKGIVLGTAGGDTVTHNMIDVILAEQQNGLVDWTNSDGFNTVKARGYNSAGTFQVGTRNANDVADIVISGAGGGTLQESGLGYKYSLGYLKRSVTTGVSAAGTVQGDATALSDGIDIHYVGTVASGTGVILANAGAGAKITVINDGANALKVYPPSGHTIAGLATDAAATVQIQNKRTFEQITSTYWAADDVLEYSAWANTTPTITAGSGSITTVTCTLAKRKLGKTLFFRAIITMTTNGTGASYLVMPLGETLAAVQTVAGLNASTGSLIGLTNGTDLRIYTDGFAYPVADGQTVYVNGVLELA